jgi:hypothetical protein
MGFLTMLGGPLIKAITDSFLGKALDAFTAYNNKQISMEELRTRVQQAMLATFAEVEKAYADSLNKTFASFMDAASKSVFMQHVWGAVALTQLAVLLWHQVGIPGVIALGWVTKYPSSGTTVDWAYALLALCLGGGAIALKTGPGAGKLAQDIKSITSK